MTIRSIDKFIESLTDWAILDGCFDNTMIRPSDIAGFVERNGVCLFLEGKGLNASLTQGQAIAFKALAAQGNTVIVFWGHGKDIRKMRIITAQDSGVVQAANLQNLRDSVSAWYVAANARKRT